MSRKYALMFAIFLFSLLIYPVSAETVQSVDALDCRFSQPAESATCSDIITATCDVSLNGFDSNIVVSRTDFEISGRSYSGECDSCDSRNQGNWTVQLSAEDRDVSRFRIDSVRVLTSKQDFPACSFTRDFSDSSTGCYGTFDSPRTLANSCSCEYTTTASAVTVDDEIVYTQIPSAGCSDQEIRQYTEFADYCDPQWVAEIDACNDGQALKEYYSANPSCCAATQDTVGYTNFNHNTGSDCVEPIDHGTLVSCEQEPYVESRATGFATSSFTRSEGFNFDNFITSSHTTRADIEPFVYDIDSNGKMDVITVDDSGQDVIVKVLDDTLTQKRSFVIPSATAVTGQFALVGVYDYGNEVIEDTSLFVNSNPLLTVNVQSGTTYENVIIEFSQDGVPSVHSRETVNAEARGIRCVEASQSCNFMDEDFNQYRYDAPTDTLFLHTNLAGLYIGGVWDTNVDPTRFETVGAATPTISVIPGQQQDEDGTVLLWTHRVENTDTGYWRGRIVITTLYGLPIGVYQLNPVFEVFSGQSPQLMWDMKDPLVRIGDQLYISTRESFYRPSEAENVDALHVHKINLGVFDQFEQSTFDPKTVFAGYSDANHNDISNVVKVNDKPGVVTSTQSPAFLEVTTQPDFIPPFIKRSVAGYVFDSDFEYYAKPPGFDGLRTTPDGQRLFITTPRGGFSNPREQSLGVHDMQDGSKIFRIDHAFANNIPPKTYYSHDKRKILHTGTTEIGFLAGTSSRITCYDVNDIFNPSSCGGYSHDSSNGYFNYVGVADDDIGLFTLGGDLYTHEYGNVSNDILANPFIPSSVATVDERVVAYDPIEDRLLTTNTLHNELNQGFYGSGGSTYTIPDGISQLAFNFDWQNPRYITPDGYLVEIESFDPLDINTAQNPCSISGWNYIPVYYNSDDHILGYAEHNNGKKVWAYCDYTNLNDPVVTLYDGAGVPEIMDETPSGEVINWFSLNLHHISDIADGEGSFGAVTAYVRGDGSSDTTSYTTWEFDANRNPPSELTESSGRTNLRIFNDNMVATTNIQKDFTFTPRNIYSADMTANTLDDVVTPFGVWDVGRFTYKEFETGDLLDYTIPIDITSDGSIDLLTLSTSVPNQMFLRTSTGTVQSITQGDFELRALRCTQLTPQRVQVQVGAAAPDPSTVRIGIDPGDGTGLYYPQLNSQGTYTYTYRSSGNYELTVNAEDTSTFETDSLTCNFEAVVPEVQNTCSLGRGSEFTYSDRVSQQGWDVIRGDDKAPFNGVLSTSLGSLYRYEFSNCRYSTVSANIKADFTSGSTYFESVDGSEQYGIKFSSDGTISNADGDTLRTFTPGSTFNIRIVASYTQNRMLLYLNEQLIDSKDTFFEVGAINIGDRANWDYVRVDATGNPYSGIEGEDELKDTEGDYDALASCDPELQKANGNVSSRLAYPSIAQYCSTQDGGDCSLSELNSAVRYNNACAKEAYNYCSDQKGSGGSLAQGAQCAAFLTFSGATTQVAFPFVSEAWGLVGKYPVQTLLIITLVVMLLPYFVRRRRGK